MLKSDSQPSDQFTSAEGPAASWFAAAVSTVGSVTVELDEAMTSPEWQLSLDTPTVYLRLGIDGPETVRRLHEFLTAHPAGAMMEFPLGMHGSQQVELLRDDEPGQRYFIVIGGGEKSALRLTIVDEECRQWARALEDIRDQLRG
jgi:hypothetical protein